MLSLSQQLALTWTLDNVAAHETINSAAFLSLSPTCGQCPGCPGAEMHLMCILCYNDLITDVHSHDGVTQRWSDYQVEGSVNTVESHHWWNLFFRLITKMFWNEWSEKRGTLMWIFPSHSLKMSMALTRPFLRLQTWSFEVREHLGASFQKPNLRSLWGQGH